MITNLLRLPLPKNIDKYFAELLPEDKIKPIESLMIENKGGKVAFVGDGINDAR